MNERSFFVTKVAKFPDLSRRILLTIYIDGTFIVSRKNAEPHIESPNKRNFCT